MPNKKGGKNNPKNVKKEEKKKKDNSGKKAQSKKNKERAEKTGSIKKTGNSRADERRQGSARARENTANKLRQGATGYAIKTRIGAVANIVTETTKRAEERAGNVGGKSGVTRVTTRTDRRNPTQDAQAKKRIVEQRTIRDNAKKIRDNKSYSDTVSKMEKVTNKIKKSAEKDLEYSAENFSDEKKYYVPIVSNQQKKEATAQAKADLKESGITVKKQRKAVDSQIAELEAEWKKQGYEVTDDTKMADGSTWGETKEKWYADTEKNTKQARKDYIAKATKDAGKLSAQDIVKGGVEMGNEMLDYLIPYGASTKVSLKVAEKLIGKGAKALGKTTGKATGKKLAEKTIAKNIDDGVEGLIKKGLDPKVAKKLSNKLKVKAFAQNATKELTANAMQDATIGTALDLGKGIADGYEGEELGKYMKQNAIWNLALGVPMTAVAGKTGAKELRKVMTEGASEAINDAIKYSAKDARELMTLEAKESKVGLTDAEVTRKAELTTKASGTGGIEVNDKGVLVQRSAVDISDVLSQKEAKEYIDLNTRATSGARLSAENQGKLNALNVKVENARKILDTNANNSLKGKVKAKNVDDLKQSVKYFERIGDSKKLKQAQKRLDEAVKLSKEKAESMVKTAEVLSKNTNIKFEVASPEAIAKAVGNNASADDIVKGVYLEQPDGTVKVMLNEQSPQAHQIVAGHESGHIIKSASSEDFDALGVMLSKYAKERGEYEDLVAEMSRSYVGESDEAFQEEVICEMIGRYIFGEDDTFIKQLAGEKPSILQQIADYIKGLLGKTTNNELREEYTRILDSMPEKIAKGTAPSPPNPNRFVNDSEVKKYIYAFGDTKTKKKTIKAWKNGERVVLRSDDEIDAFIRDALKDTSIVNTAGYGKVSKNLSDKAKKLGDGYNIEGYYTELNPNDLRHSLENHDNLPSGELPITEDDVANIPNWLDGADDVFDPTNGSKGKRFKVGKRINGYSVIVTMVSDGRGSIHPKALHKYTTEAYKAKYGKKIKKTSVVDARPNSGEGGYNNPSTFKKPSIENIPQGEPVVKKSQEKKPTEDVGSFNAKKLFDADGKVTKETDDAYMQAVKVGDTDTAQKYVDAVAETKLKDSVVRTPDGKLEKMYHGSTEDFDVFDKDKIRAGDYDAPFNGFWFSSDKRTSPAFRDAKYTKGVYLDIKKPAPFDVWDKVSEEVFDDKQLRESARSFNDEVRYRLQDDGYDGIQFDGAFEFTQKNVDEFNKTGETTFKSASGRGTYKLVRQEVGENEFPSAKLYGNGYEIMDAFDAEHFLEDNSFGSPYRTNDVWVVFEPTQIKSFEPVTKHNGEIVPLSKRFDDTNRNIKFSKESKEAKQFESSLAERLKNGEDIDTLFDDAYKFIKEKTPQSYEEPVENLKELRDARRLMRTTDIRVTTTDVTKGLSINRLLENVGYDKKTIGSKIKLKKNSGISIETAYHRLQEVDSTRFPDLDTEEDMLRRMCEVAQEDTRGKTTIDIPDKEYEDMVKQEAKDMLERAYSVNENIEKAKKGLEEATFVTDAEQTGSVQSSIDGEKTDILRDAKVSDKPVSDLSVEELNKEYKSLGFGIKNGKTEEHIKLRKDRQAEIKAELEKRGEFTPSKNEEVETLISEKGYGWEKAKEYNDKLTELREKEKKLKENGSKEELDSVKNEIKDTTKKLYDTVDQSKSNFDESKDILEQAKERGGGNTIKVNKATWKDLLKESDNKGGFLVDRVHEFAKSGRRLFESSLIDFETTGKALMNSTDANKRALGKALLDQTNMVYVARNKSASFVEGKRANIDGKITGEGLNDIFKVEYNGKTIDLLKDEKMREDLSNYLFYKHALGNRHELDKDVFGSMYTQREISMLKDALINKYGGEVVDGVVKKNSKLLDTFESKIRAYIDDLNQYRLDAGLISKEQLKTLEERYPFYVPTFRAGLEKTQSYELPSGLATVDTGIKTATGGDQPLEELYLQLVKMTDRTIKSSEQNKMLQLYAKAKGFDTSIIKDANPEDIAHTSITAEEQTKGNWRITFFEDGKSYTMPVNKQCAKGLREWNGQDFATLINFFGKFSGIARPYKGLITDWNLIFGVRNGIRDQQQAFVNSVDSRWYAKSLPRAMGALDPLKRNKDNAFRMLYEANGGKWSSIAQYNKLEDLTSLNKHPVKKMTDATIGKGLDVIENINGAIELVPRLSEFIGTIQKEADNLLKKEGSSIDELFKKIETRARKEGLTGDKLTEAVEMRYAEAVINKINASSEYSAIIQKAMRNSADITLNFSRSGVIGKALNSGVVPYLNPSIQGMSKLARMFSEGKANGTLINFLMKLSVVTVAPSVLNEVLCAGNQAYQDLNTRDKDGNYFIPMSLFGGDADKFIKIPKPRENAVLAEPAEYFTRFLIDSAQYGTAGEFKQMFKSAWDNVGVLDAGDFIFAPIIDTAMNKTWYGGEIESAYERDKLAPKDRYDETTSAWGIWIGQKTGLSPKKVDNIMDSYLGLFYDLGISQTAESTKGNPIINQFVKDSVFSNKLATNYWDNIHKLDNGAVGDSHTQEYRDAMSKGGYDVFTYSNAIASIDSDKDIPKDKRAEVKRELKKYQNALYRQLNSGGDVKVDPMQRIINVYKKAGVKNPVDKALNSFAYGDHKEAYNRLKSRDKYQEASPKERREMQNEFLKTYKGIKRIGRESGGSDDYLDWTTAVFACRNANCDKEIATSYVGKSWRKWDNYTLNKVWDRCDAYIEAGYTEKNYTATQRALYKGSQKLGLEYPSELKDHDKAMILAGKGYRDGAYYITSTYVEERMNSARCLQTKYETKTKEIKKFADKHNLVYDEDEGWNKKACNKVIKAINKDYADAPAEKKASIYQVITGDHENKPFGEIGDYSLKKDTGLSTEEKSKGGRGGRGRRRGHGGGGSGGGKGEMIKTESGAVKGKVTNPFGSNTSSKSNLNDAYRKKVKKLREQTR